MKVLIVLVAVLGCTLALHKGFRLSEKSQRIVGGEDAPKGLFTSIASLQYGYSLVHPHICACTILSESWVVTAGHCKTEVPGLPWASFYVKAGIHNLNDNGQTREVDNTIVHSGYTGGVGPNDIALMHLKKPLDFNDFVQPAKLPQAGVKPEGESVLAGWGSTSTGIIPILPSTLQTIKLPLLTYEQCVDALIALQDTSDPLAETNLCTGPIDVSGQGACSGDSGGPLYRDLGANGFELIGVVSWGMIPCGSLGAPSVYTLVSSFNDFIVENTKG